MVAAQNTDVIVGPKDRCSGRPALRSDLKPAGDSNAQSIWRIVESVDSQIVGADVGISDGVREEFAGRNPIRRYAE